jgi:hypothetical protein
MRDSERPRASVFMGRTIGDIRLKEKGVPKDSPYLFLKVVTLEKCF